MGDNNTVTITFTKEEYNKVRECIKSIYDLTKKAPKNLRTPNFYFLENIYNTKFNLKK